MWLVQICFNLFNLVFLDVLILSIQQLCTLFEERKISINHKFKIIIVRTNYNQQTKKMHQFFFYVCSINCTKSNITHTIYICIQIPRKHWIAPNFRCRFFELLQYKRFEQSALIILWMKDKCHFCRYDVISNWFDLFVKKSTHVIFLLGHYRESHWLCTEIPLFCTSFFRCVSKMALAARSLFQFHYSLFQFHFFRTVFGWNTFFFTWLSSRPADRPNRK